MVMLIFGCVLLAILLLGVTLLKTYTRIPIKELKRQATSGDEIARALWRPVAYGTRLRILLWGIIGLSASLLLVLVARIWPWPLAALATFFILILCFAWLPGSPLSRLGVILARYIAPTLQWVLDRTRPVLEPVERLLKKTRPVTVHSGLFSKNDLLDLIRQQKIQIDNRITKSELRIAAHALTFGDKTVGHVMTPYRKIKMVSASDLVGPILMAELHDSGHSRFPVYQDDKNNVVGTLYLHDLVTAKKGGLVKSCMKRDVFYVHENQPLMSVLDAFLKTQHHMFLAVNSFEEIVGVITIEDILEQILGKNIVDEFDKYDDLRAVAAKEAKDDIKKHKTHHDTSGQKIKDSKDLPEQSDKNTRA